MNTGIFNYVFNSSIFKYEYLNFGQTSSNGKNWPNQERCWCPAPCLRWFGTLYFITVLHIWFLLHVYLGIDICNCSPMSYHDLLWGWCKGWGLVKDLTDPSLQWHQALKLLGPLHGIDHFKGQVCQIEHLQQNQGQEKRTHSGYTTRIPKA